jgi:predicted acetyltransferase
MIEKPINLQKIDNESISNYLIKFDDSVIRYFPLIRGRRFYFYLKSLYVIQHENLEKGLIFFTKSKPGFEKYGSIEASIIIFPEYRNIGLGKMAIKELYDSGISLYFLVRKDNAVAFNFFNEMPFVILLTLENSFSVFTFLKY